MQGKRASESSERDARTGPTAADLVAIEAEWPVIAAELAALDAEIAALSSRGVSELHVRRARRARRRVLRAAPTLARFGWDGEAA